MIRRRGIDGQAEGVGVSIEGRQPPPVVINADDLGMSPAVNHAILSALELGLVSSATIMATMPAFDEACQAVLARGLSDRIGVHLSLTEGSPCSEAIRRLPALVTGEGVLRRRGTTVWVLRQREAQAIAAELAAQIQAVIAAGIRPAHLDSHHHVHTQWPIAAIVIALARRFEIPAVRLSRTCGSGIGVTKRVYKAAVNARFARAGLALTSDFGSVADIATLKAPRRPLEVMVHPAFDGGGRIIDRGHPEWPLDEVRDRLPELGRLVSYRELATMRAEARRSA